MSGKEPWNKGLTKNSDPRLAKVSEAARNRPGKKLSPETRRKLSEMSKKRYSDNPELHPNRILAANRSQMTYPERVAHDWLTKNEIPFLYNERVGKYFPDFLVGTTIIEIDGERWHPEDSERDSERDAYLSSLGYTIFRIRSRERIEDRLAEIFNLGLNLQPLIKPIGSKPKLANKRREKKVKYSEERLSELFSLVKEANIDIFHYGWVSKVANLWNVSHTQVIRLFNKYWNGPKPYSRKRRNR